MNEEIKKILKDIYINHKLHENNLDYKILDKYSSELSRFSQLSNSCFFIVDLYKFEYVYTSDNFKNIFGYIPVNKSDSSFNSVFLDSKIHPDDFIWYKKVMPKVGEFILELPKEKRTGFKHVFELRMQNIQKQYVYISWERQALETDTDGNLWLMLGILNILPGQDNTAQPKSFFINLETGERIPFNLTDSLPFELSTREIQILRLIQLGLLSKEIAHQLKISINTVNIHRQNILHKMNADNSLEAVNIARKYKILE